MKKMISSIVLLALVSSMIFSSIPVSVYADSQSDSLIRIASQARDQVKIQLSKVDVTPEIKEKFELASKHIELLIEAAKIEDVPAARENFLAAMTIINEIIQHISERPAASEAALSADSAPSVDTSRIAQELDRLERYIAQLKRIASNHEFELDSSKSDISIEQARIDLREGNTDSAISAIPKIKDSIVELNQILKEKTRQYTTDRAKTLAGKHLEDLDRLIDQAKEMGDDDILEKLLQAKENLDSLSDATVEQIINHVKRIIDVKNDFEKSKLDRFEARYQDLKSKFDRFSSSSSDIPELEKAKTMFSELRDLVSSGSFDEAIRLLTSLNNLINEIQNSMNVQEEASVAAEERQTSLSDSKLERIKIKIQRVQESLNQLEEEVQDNAASKRWLNNAFSMLEDAKNQVDDSPDNALKIIMKIEQIIKRIQTYSNQ